MQAVHTVEGTITEYEWGNPHVYLSVRENGSDRVFVVEAFPSTAMKQYGWSKDTFALGERVVVAGHPGRNPESTALFLQAARKASSTAWLYDAGGAVAAPPPAAPQTFKAASLEGTWQTSVGPTFGSFFGPAVAQLGTPQGAAAVAEFRDDTANPGLQCVPFTAPVYMILPGFRSIDVRADAVVIRGEDAAVERVVHLDVATHDGAPASVQGHSIGRWDDGALVVDTAGFAPHRLGNGGRLAVGRAQASRRAVRIECARRSHLQLRARRPRILEGARHGRGGVAVSPRRRVHRYALRSTTPAAFSPSSRGPQSALPIASRR